MPTSDGDLRLCPTFEEAQVHDLAFALGQHRQEVAHRDAVFDRVELFVVSAEPFVSRARVVAGASGIDRRETIETVRFHRFDHVFFPRTRSFRDLSRRRRSSKLLRERGDGVVELEMQLLDAPGDAHRPPFVAEVALELADDRRRRERRELQAAFGIEALDCLQQPDERDLAEIVQLLAAVLEASREELGKAHVVFDERVAQIPITGSAILREPRIDLAYRFVLGRVPWLIDLGSVALGFVSAGHACPTTEGWACLTTTKTTSDFS